MHCRVGRHPLQSFDPTQYADPCALAFGITGRGQFVGALRSVKPSGFGISAQNLICAGPYLAVLDHAMPISWLG